MICQLDRGISTFQINQDEEPEGFESQFLVICNSCFPNKLISHNIQRIVFSGNTN